MFVDKKGDIWVISSSPDFLANGNHYCFLAQVSSLPRACLALILIVIVIHQSFYHGFSSGGMMQILPIDVDGRCSASSSGAE